VKTVRRSRQKQLASFFSSFFLALSLFPSLSFVLVARFAQSRVVTYFQAYHAAGFPFVEREEHSRQSLL
jgi:nitrate reductase NapE component